MNTAHHNLQNQVLFLTQRVKELEAENLQLKTKLEDSKLINRAKAVLMKKYRLQETEAHRTLQKTAMDLRVPLATLAKRVLEGEPIPDLSRALPA